MALLFGIFGYLAGLVAAAAALLFAFKFIAGLEPPARAERQATPSAVAQSTPQPQPAGEESGEPDEQIGARRRASPKPPTRVQARPKPDRPAPVAPRPAWPKPGAVY